MAYRSCLKHDLMLFYLQSLVLLVARRAAGDTLEDRTPASLSFSTAKRDARAWAGVGDLVDSMIEGRVVLEKIKVLENRIKYQIEKLVRIANDASKNVTDDPLAFRPNPQNLVDNDQAPNAASDAEENACDKRSKCQPKIVVRPPLPRPVATAPRIFLWPGRDACTCLRSCARDPTNDRV
ncbi:hypothetical protein L210DRAFT_3545572 [Boletus edulis BED1]|uniref:Uncharacterized protein n=1 Tax=Boletus edulis BED1 TaxID=1328754 RepID=A0AAD4BRP9_BOLED|nr:hypothetical protein L210DRAFT_3545572 [Boletus edulis BED1]